MKNRSRLATLFVLAGSAVFFLMLAPPVVAQVTTGVPAFGSFGGGPDIVNLGNLNAELIVPLVNKAGRGTNFTYSLTYDTSVLYPITVNGVLTWQPVANWGWRAQTQAYSGYVTYQTTEQSACNGNGREYIASHFIYSDSFAVPHAFLGQATTIQGNTQCNTGNNPLNAYALDNSGYKLYVPGGLGGAITVTSASGKVISPPVNTTTGAASVTDNNGNEISVNTSGQFTDTLGQTVLAIAGGAPNPVTFTYKVPSGAAAVDTIKYTTYNIQTAFGCSGIAEYAASNVSLISEIDMPDQATNPSDRYTFSYEYTSGTSGPVTGRLAKVTLPTGGWITYSYSGGTNGITCADGTAATLTRATPDGSWTYAHSESGTSWNTLVTDPLSNQTNMTFNTIYETSRQVNSGASTLQATVNTCYNGAFSGSTCTAAPNLPAVTEKTVFTQWPGTNGLVSKTDLFYNSSGLMTEDDDYGYGAGAPGGLIRKSIMSYVTRGSAIRVGQLNVLNGTGGVVASTLYTYDSTTIGSIAGTSQHNDTSYGVGYTTRGNLTEVQNLVSGSTYLISLATYDETGQMLTTTDPANNTSTFSYSDNLYIDNGSNPPQTFTPSKPTNAYVHTVTLPILGLYATYGYYVYSGETALGVDVNGADTYTHYDAMDRLSSQYLPPASNGIRGWTLAQYPSRTQTDTYTAITSSSPSTSCTSCVHQESFTDTMGRPVSRVLASDPDGATTQTTSFDARGRVESVTNPYRTTSDPTYGTSTISYDALNRVTAKAYADGSTDYTYFGSQVGTNGGNATQLCSTATYGAGYPNLSVDAAGKKRELWTDSLGRIIETDEANSSGSLTVPTCYAYDALGDVTQVVQGTQTRSYSYDGLGRVTSESTPEAGSVGISYTNSSGGLCSGDPAVICRKTNNLGVVTTYTYDALNRLTGISYSDGVTPNIQYFYDQASYNGLSISNGKSRNTGMSDGSGTSAYSFDLLGQPKTENHTIAGVTKSMSYTFNLDGSISSLTYPSGRQIAYAYSNAQRPLNAIDSTTGVNYASAATYAPNSAVSGLLIGKTSSFAGITEANTYSKRFQLKTQQSSSSAGALLNLTYGYPAAPGNNDQLTTITNNIDNGRTVTVGYDPLNRISSAKTQATSGADCWGQTYGYDVWGNILSLGISQCSGTPLNLTIVNNKISTTGYVNDGNGNLTNDAINAYGYDAANHIITAAGATYVYDGRDLRVKKSTGTLYWRSFQGDVFTESDLSGNTSSDYVYFDGARTTRLDNLGNAYYYFLDKLGSTRAMANSAGTKCYDADFTAFGTEVNHSNSCPQNYKFTGYERDTESGLDYATHRYYSSRLGRFTSADPLKGNVRNPQSLNRYTYVLNNPCNLIDPSGLCDVVAGGLNNSPASQAIANFAGSIGADDAYPFSSGGVAGGLGNFMAGSQDANAVLTNAILDAYSQTPQGQQVNLFLFSGSAQIFQNIYSSLPKQVQGAIGNITYLSPGIKPGGSLIQGNGQTNVYTGSGAKEAVVTGPAVSAANNEGIAVYDYTGGTCGHSSGCAFQPSNDLGQYAGAPCNISQTFSRQHPGGIAIVAPDVNDIQNINILGGIIQPNPDDGNLSHMEIIFNPDPNDPANDGSTDPIIPDCDEACDANATPMSPPDSLQLASAPLLLCLLLLPLLPIVRRRALGRKWSKVD